MREILRRGLRWTNANVTDLNAVGRGIETQWKQNKFQNSHELVDGFDRQEREIMEGS